MGTDNCRVYNMMSVWALLKWAGDVGLQKLSVHCMYRCYLMYIIQYTYLLSHVHDWHHYWSTQKTRQHDSCPAAAPRLVWQHICQQIGWYGGNWSHGVRCWAPRVWTQPLQGQYMCQDLLINGLEEQQGVHLESKCHIWCHMTDLALLIDCNSYSVMQMSAGQWGVGCEFFGWQFMISV